MSGHGGTRKGAGRKPGNRKPHRPVHSYSAHHSEKAAADKVLASAGIKGVGELVRGIGAGSVLVFMRPVIVFPVDSVPLGSLKKADSSDS